jgi:hypothetical protein
MGLMIHSLGELPANVERDYYVYLLDYGWEEAASDATYTNFARMAEVASKNNAAVFRGTVGHHFADEVLSWRHINGQDADGVLPAILITTKHPRKFGSSAEFVGELAETRTSRGGAENSKEISGARLEPPAG